MKKLFLPFVLLVGTAGVAQAQSAATLGLKVGVVAANVSGKDAGDSDNHFGVQAGVFANVGISDLFSFQPELLYSQKGYQFKESGVGEVKTTLHYIDLPLLLHVNADGLFFEGGPQLGYLAGQKTKYDITNMGSGTNTDADGLRKFDVGYIAGLGYQLESGLSLGVRYNGGLSSIIDSGDAKVHNSVFQFQLGYRLGGK